MIGSLVRSLVREWGTGGGTGGVLTLSGVLPNGVAGDDYLGVLNISGGVPPYSNPLIIGGVLDPDLILTIVGSQLQVSGVPLNAGFEAAILQIQDSIATLASLPVSFTLSDVTFILTEDNRYIQTEDNRYLIAE